jgi:Glycosyl transferase family 2
LNANHPQPRQTVGDNPSPAGSMKLLPNFVANENTFATASKVSVLVPVYNGEKFLAECLDSILAQDFRDMEILIADDGSTDGSTGLIEKYAARDGRIRWWRNPVNLGLAGNFNDCLRAARNEYVKYVLQDDVLLSPSAVRQMVQALDADPSVTLVASASHVIDGRGERIEFRNSFRRSGVMDGKAAILHSLARDGNYIGEPSVVMFRRDQAGRGYDERYRQLLDLDFWFHLLEQGRLAYLAEPLCAFRRHAKQQTAVNYESGGHVQDELMLAQYWLSRPWLRGFTCARLQFQQVYALEKRYGERARPFTEKIRASLKPGGCKFYWLEYKITRPFTKLNRWLQKRFAPRPPEQTAPLKKNDPINSQA